HLLHGLLRPWHDLWRGGAPRTSPVASRSVGGYLCPVRYRQRRPGGEPMIDFADHFAKAPYFGYSYAYPHKSAYRPLDPPTPLDEAWRDEPTDSLFLYLHVPFCEYRCGFCNLFTLANAEAGWVTRYLRQLRVEASAMADLLPGAHYAQVAI